MSQSGIPQHGTNLFLSWARSLVRFGYTLARLTRGCWHAGQAVPYRHLRALRPVADAFDQVSQVAHHVAHSARTVDVILDGPDGIAKVNGSFRT
jgi:hypothetical protein